MRVLTFLFLKYVVDNIYHIIVHIGYYLWISNKKQKKIFFKKVAGYAYR